MQTLEQLLIKHLNGAMDEMNTVDYPEQHAKYIAEKLTEDGVILLPCNVGDTVYEANGGRNIISTYKVISITVTKHGLYLDWELVKGIYTNLRGFCDYAIGKTIFLTEAAAQKRIEEMNDGTC